MAQIDRVDLCTLPPHAYILMTIYYLQKLKPPILPVLHEIINSKRVNGTRSTKTSISVNNLPCPSEPAIDEDEYFDESNSDDESDEEGQVISN